MTQNPNTRKKIRNILISINITLGVIFLLLFLWGMFIVRTKQIDAAVKLNQYVKFNLYHLPEDVESIKPDI